MQPISIPGAKQSYYDLLHIASVCYLLIVSVLYSIVLVMQGIVEDDITDIVTSNVRAIGLPSKIHVLQSLPGVNESL